MSTLKRYNGSSWETIGGSITGDTLPIGSEVDYDGANVPAGWQEISNDLVVDSIKSKNLLIDKCFINAYISNTGAITSANNNALFGYIEVEPNTTYTMSVNSTISSMMIGEYNNSKTWLQRPLANSVSKLTITTSANTKYVRVAINKDNASTMTQSIIDSLEPQFEKGDTATTYKPYQNLNGAEHYTTTEQAIGTWIDGNPLYRKVITFTTASTSVTTWTTCATINDLKRPVNISGYLEFGASTSSVIPTFESSSQRLQFSFSGGNIQYQQVGYNSKPVYAVILYTKTTD